MFSKRFSPRTWGRSAVALAATSLCLVGAARESAAAMMFGVTDGGVVSAVGCMDAACGASQTFDDDLLDFAAVSGTIMIDTGAGTLDLSLGLQAGQVVALSAPGGDVGVSTVDFEDVIYSVSGLTLTEVIPGAKYIVGASQTASVSGDYSQNAAAAAGFAAAAARITGVCDIVGDSVTCGLSFGTTDFELGIGAGPDMRYFRHTMNVTGIVPEPSTGLLLGFGLLALARRRR